MTGENMESGESLSYSQKVELVNKLFTAAQARNRFAKNAGGGSAGTFFAVSAHDDATRMEYERLSIVFDDLRAEVDSIIVDKEEFAEQLEDSGEKVMAEKFRRMFKTLKPPRSFGETVKDFLKDEGS